MPITMEKYKVNLQKLSEEQRRSLLAGNSLFIQKSFDKNNIVVNNVIESEKTHNKITDNKGVG